MKDFELAKPRLPVITICHSAEDGCEAAVQVSMHLAERLERRDLKATLRLREGVAKEKVGRDDEVVIFVQTQDSISNNLFGSIRAEKDIVVNFAPPGSPAFVSGGYDWLEYSGQEDSVPPGLDELVNRIDERTKDLQLRPLDVAVLFYGRNGRSVARKIEDELRAECAIHSFNCRWAKTTRELEEELHDDAGISRSGNLKLPPGIATTENDQSLDEKEKTENDRDDDDDQNYGPGDDRPPEDMLLAKVIVHVDTGEFQGNRKCMAVLQKVADVRRQIMHIGVGSVSPRFPVTEYDGTVRAVGLMGNPAKQFKDVSEVAKSIRNRLFRIPKVFLSYCREDSAQVYSAKCAIELMGCEVYFDRQIPPRVPWPDVVENRIQSSDATIAFCSEECKDSEPFKAESRKAYQLRKCIAVGLDEYFKNLDLGHLTVVTESKQESFSPYSDSVRKLVREIHDLTFRNHKYRFVQVDKNNQSDRQLADTLAKSLRADYRIVNKSFYSELHEELGIFPGWLDTYRERATVIYSIWPDKKTIENEELPDHFLSLSQLNDLGGEKKKVIVYLESQDDIDATKDELGNINFRLKDDLRTGNNDILDGPEVAKVDDVEPIGTGGKSYNGQSQPIPQKVEVHSVLKSDQPIEVNAPSVADAIHELNVSGAHNGSSVLKNIRDVALIVFSIVGAVCLAVIATTQGCNDAPNYNEALTKISASIDNSIAKNVDGLAKLEGIETKLGDIDQTIKEKTVTVNVEGISAIANQLKEIQLIMASEGNDNRDLLTKLVAAEQSAVEQLQMIATAIENIDPSNLTTVIQDLVSSNQTLVTQVEIGNSHLEVIGNHTEILGQIVVELQNIQKECCDDERPPEKIPGKGPPPEYTDKPPMGIDKMTAQQRQKASLFYYVLARHTFFCGDYSTTIVFLDRAIALCNLDARYFYFRGLSKKRMGDEPEGAIDVCIAIGLENELGTRNANNLALQRIQGHERIWLEKIRHDPYQYPVLGPPIKP